MIADDHALLRDGMRLRLERLAPDFVVSGEAGSVAELRTALVGAETDVLLLDVSMPPYRNTLSLLPELLGDHRDLRVVVVTVHHDPQLASDALAAGARGYVLKNIGGTELVETLRSVAAGSVVFWPASLASDVGSLTAEQEHLSRRETEIVRLLALGQTSRQIAETLHLAISTVKTHRSRAMRKLGAHSREELTRYALRHRLLEPEREPAQPGV
jgi:DNA-binding NarL/FixJ family response regulator